MCYSSVVAPDDTLRLTKVREPGRSSVRRIAPLPDADAPRPGEVEREDSGQVFVDALREVERGSPAEAALVRALDLLAKHRESPNQPPGTVSSTLLVKLALVCVAALSVVAPAVQQGLALLLAPRTAIESKLDEVIAGQAALRDEQRQGRSEVVALTRWVVDCETARRNGLPMPEPPAAVRLMLAQDDVARSTGP